MSDQWQEVKGFQGYPFWDFDADGAIEGTFAGTRIINTRDVINGGVRESTVHDVLESKTKGWSVWGTTDLDSKMVQVEKGDLVRIEFLGKEDIQVRGVTRKIKKYDVKRAPGAGLPVPTDTSAAAIASHNPDDDIPF